MSEMIERVARAIVAEFQRNSPSAAADLNMEWSAWASEARAAIEAMREPTEAMINDGYEPIRFTEVAAHKHAGEVWRAMIDTVLAEIPTIEQGR